jgi:GT2 family glycosyltransferase
VFALNSDVWLSAHYFDTLLQYFDDNNTFGVMGKIIDLEGDKIQDGAKYPQKKGFQIKSTLNFLLKDIEPGFKVPTFFLSGANALMDRHKLFQIMAYNEIYAPFYVEDVDLSLKAWRMGWKCYFDEKAICRHPVSVTIGKHNRKNFIKTTSIRNQMILQELHLDGFELVGWRLQLLFNVLTKWITLNTRFYNAFFQLISKWNLVQKSKAEFNTLLNNHGKSKRISQVISEIKNSIAQYPIQYF